MFLFTSSRIMRKDPDIALERLDLKDSDPSTSTASSGARFEKDAMTEESSPFHTHCTAHMTLPSLSTQKKQINSREIKSLNYYMVY